MVRAGGLRVTFHVRLGSSSLWQEICQVTLLPHTRERQEGRAARAPTHSSERQAGQGHVHEAVIPAEAPAAGLGQHPLDHLGESRVFEAEPGGSSLAAEGPGPWHLPRVGQARRPSQSRSRVS